MKPHSLVTQPKTPNQTQRYNDRVSLIQSFIKSYFSEKGYSPTAEELAQHCGFKSRSNIWYWLDLMKENGQLEFNRRIGRSFRLPGQTVTFPDHTR